MVQDEPHFIVASNGNVSQVDGKENTANSLMDLLETRIM